MSDTPKSLNQQAFRRMLAAGDVTAVAWDRDVDQSLITETPRLYTFACGVTVVVGAYNDRHAAHYVWREGEQRWERST